MDIRSFKQDPAKVAEGVVRKFDAEGKVYIRVARQNNPKFEKAMRTALEPYKNHRKSKIPDKIIEECTKRAMAQTILIEMVGFTDGGGDITGTKGAKIEDTEENRYKVLMHKDYGEFVELVSTISLDFDTYRAEMDEEQEGKSERPSDGSGPGAAKKSS